MLKLKIAALIAVSAWSFAMWQGYFEKKNTATTILIEVDGGNNVAVSPFQQTPKLTQKFWKWEAAGRLRLIDTLIDDKALINARLNWTSERVDLDKKADHLIALQMQSYRLPETLEPPRVEIIPLRGDANGLYIPSERTIYLNSKMQWESLSYERFVEVVLHENMHHIMTYAMTVFSEEDPLRQDFLALTQSAFFHNHNGMGNDRVEPTTVNPQELVAYRTQRAARYAGIVDAGLSTWEMSARMQEIRVLTKKAGL